MIMAVSLVAGSAVGVGLDRALKMALDLVNKTRDFRPTLERYRETCDGLEPLVENIKRLNNELGRPNEEVERLENAVRATRELVNKYSGSGARGWRYMFRPFYRDMLQRRGQNLVRILTEELPVHMARDLKETLCKVTAILENLYLKGTLSLRGLSAPPKKPEFTVGLDEPFKKLKLELLKDKGPPILMLTGLEGSGKSTLAKMLCWDDQIQGYFFINVLCSLFCYFHIYSFNVLPF